MSKKTLFVVDAYNLIYRMFYAIPEMTTRHGDPVQAIFGVAKFLKALAEDNEDATLVVATDVGQSFRAELFSEYKGTRERMPDALRSQIDGVFGLFTAAGIHILSREGYEADDLIGSIAHQHENDEYQVVIISSDKDLCQFVRDGHVHIYDAMKRKFMKESDVVEKFGVPAYQVRDYLAIVGDSSDNIPGIAGFGPKKAVDLLTKYDTLEGIYENLVDLTPKMQEVLIAQKENAFLSQKLASIITDLEVINLPDSPFAPGIYNQEYIDILKFGRQNPDPASGYNYGTFQIGGSKSTPESSMRKYEECMRAGISLAKRHGIDVSMESVVDPGQKDLITHLGYIETQRGGSNTFAMLRDKNLSDGELIHLMSTKIQGGIDAIGKSVVAQMQHTKIDTTTLTA